MVRFAIDAVPPGAHAMGAEVPARRPGAGRVRGVRDPARGGRGRRADGDGPGHPRTRAHAGRRAHRERGRAGPRRPQRHRPLADGPHATRTAGLALGGLEPVTYRSLRQRAGFSAGPTRRRRAGAVRSHRAGAGSRAGRISGKVVDERGGVAVESLRAIARPVVEDNSPSAYDQFESADGRFTLESAVARGVRGETVEAAPSTPDDRFTGEGDRGRARRDIGTAAVAARSRHRPRNGGRHGRRACGRRARHASARRPGSAPR